MRRICDRLPPAHCLLPAAFCLLVVARVPSLALAQCTGDRCPSAAVPHPAVVRVANVTAGGSQCYASGTLVHKDAKRAIVLTCAHLFDRGAGKLVVTFPKGHWCQASLLAADRVWDLAALSVTTPEATPARIAADHPRPGDPLQSCGYGADGRYWCNQGRALGYAKPAAADTYETLQLSGYARDGDSGGPVFNQRGEMVAVLWGTDGRTVGGTYCGRIRKFLARVLSLGCLPRGQPDSSPPAPGPAPPDQPTRPILSGPLDSIRQRLDSLAGKLDDTQRQRDQRNRSWTERLERIEKAMALLAALKGRLEKAEAAVGGESLRAVVREVAVGILADQAPGLAQTLLPAVLAALGWTGPPSIAVILGIRLLAGILRSRAAKRRRPAPGGTGRRSQPSRQLNDEYAEQLAGVYALSGRSPIADATLGREYDQELRRAEQSSDNALARWARNLRQRVAKRFYRIHGQSPVPAEPPEET